MHSVHKSKFIMIKTYLSQNSLLVLNESIRNTSYFIYICLVLTVVSVFLLYLFLGKFLGRKVKVLPIKKHIFFLVYLPFVDGLFYLSKVIFDLFSLYIIKYDLCTDFNFASIYIFFVFSLIYYIILCFLVLYMYELLYKGCFINLWKCFNNKITISLIYILSSLAIKFLIITFVYFVIVFFYCYLFNFEWNNIIDLYI